MPPDACPGNEPAATARLANGWLFRARAADGCVPDPAAVDHRHLVQDAAGDLNQSPTAVLASDSAELCRWADAWRVSVSLRQQLDHLDRRGFGLAHGWRSCGVRIRASALHGPFGDVFLASGDAHAAADRGAVATLRLVQQGRTGEHPPRSGHRLHYI